MTQQQLTSVVQAYLGSWNREQADKAASYFADDGVYMDMALNENISPAGLGDYIRTYFSVGEISIQTIGDYEWFGNKVFYQAHTFGKSHNGHDVNVFSAEYIELNGDKIASHKTYYDFVPKQSADVYVKHYRKQAGDTFGKYQKSSLRDEQVASYKRKLLYAMEIDMLYRDHNLSLKKLAANLHMSIHHLSQMINSQFGMTFFELVHHYRVEEAKAILVKPEMAGRAVLDIADDLGFNSSSTFYAAFKKHAGMTPVEYKKLNSVACGS